VEKAAKDAGLLWAVARQPGISPLGNPDAVGIVENLPRSNQQNGGERCHSISITPPIRDLHSIIEIRLPSTGTQVWFGVARAGFGIELDFPSPWKLFVEHLAEIADAALVRLTAAMELENLRTEAAQYQGLATVAVTTGTLIHQIVNMAKDLTGPASELLEAYQVGELKCDEDDGKLINAMSESAQRLLELTSNITNVTKLDERRPCSLFDAAHQSTKLFEHSLAQHCIRLENNIARDIIIDIPFHVAALAIANLISNAKDAIGKSGKGSVIVIDAENSMDMVHCYVTDDGPGIADDIRDQIFDVGVTTKPNSGGWGLYLVARSLWENRGSIGLAETSPCGTKFTIRFPKERREG
jgi:signal transduction histidine kinase